MSGFYVIGVGRSGTLTVSTALRRDRQLCCIHEPDRVADGKAVVSAVRGEPQDAYIRNVRNPYMMSKVPMWDHGNGRTSKRSGEVNSFLRYHAAALRRANPSAVIAHLVRNPVDVIKSLYARSLYEPQMRGCRQLVIPGVRRWKHLPRIEKICWFWAHGNRAAREGADYSARLEDISSSFSMWEKFALPLGCHLTEAAWKAAFTYRRNRTKEFRVRELPEEWEDAFSRICRDEMLLSGYEEITDDARV